MVKSQVTQVPCSRSPDGTHLVFIARDPKTQLDLWLLPLSGEPKPKPIVQMDFDQYQGRLSPDGKWLAYVSNESKKEQVYLQRLDLPSARIQVSTSGGRVPHWRSDGQELFYLSPDNKLMSVKVRTAGMQLELDLPEVLFEVPQLAAIYYDVSRDGRRFLMISRRGEGSAITPITVVVNWPAKFGHQLNTN